MKKTITITLALLLVAVLTYSQNEFYINGALLKVDAGALIHVQGDFHLDNEGVNDGRLDNDGTIELRGNFMLNNDNVEQTSVGVNSTGVVRFKNYGYSTETAHQNASQRIEMMGVDATGDKAFYNIEIENDNRTDAASSADNYVDISGGDVEVKNVLKFNNNSRLVTDDAGFSSNDGSTYSNEVYISSTNVDAIDFGPGLNDATKADHRIQAGRSSRFIEGNLAREVAGTASYYFPVGLQPNFVGNDGMEAFNLDVTSAPAQKISAYVNSGPDRTYMGNQNIYGDMGEDPGAGLDPFTNCVGSPDGIQDFLYLNDAHSHEWQIDNAGADFTYNIEIYPGLGLNGTAPNAMSGATYFCGSHDFVIRYLVKDGALYNRSTGELLAAMPAPHPFNTSTDFTWGYRYLPPATELEGNYLNNMTSFSTFRIHTAENVSTVLPVTIASFEAYPVNSEFIQLAWLTLSETNNDFFDVQRSTDLLRWETLGYVEGSGTTTEQQTYLFDDYAAEFGVTYYYRLKQVDFDGNVEYIGPDDAKLETDGLGLTVSEFIPSPATQSSIIQITTSEDINLSYLFYNGLGQIIKQGNIEVPAGSVKQSLEFNELNRLAASTYFLTLSDGENMFYRTLLKSN